MHHAPRLSVPLRRIMLCNMRRELEVSLHTCAQLEPVATQMLSMARDLFEGFTMLGRTEALGPLDLANGS